MAQMNHKVVRTLGKLIEAGFDNEKSILSMTMDDILELPGISVAEIGIINEIQKAVKANKVIAFLGGAKYKKIVKKGRVDKWQDITLWKKDIQK